MKVLIFNLLLALFSALGLNAQSQYEAGMNRAFELWKNNDAQAAANLFERIASAEKTNWLPYYYASQVKIVESFPITNVVQKEQLLQESQQLLDAAKAIAAEEVELQVLQAMLYTSRLTIDPATYGMKLSPVISEIYARARQKAPENPRVLLSKAEWDMGAAAFMGKDPAAACPDLEKSLELFAAENHSALTAPAWGKDRAIALLNRSCGK